MEYLLKLLLYICRKPVDFWNVCETSTVSWVQLQMTENGVRAYNIENHLY
jgi:hypothetical protein